MSDALVTAEIDPKSLAMIDRTIQRGLQKLNWGMETYVKKAMAFSVVSAAKATKPYVRNFGRGQAPLSLRYRELRKYQGMDYAYQATFPGKSKPITWHTELYLPRGMMKRLNIKRARKQIAIYSYKYHALLWIPYFGDATGKYDRKSRIGRVPRRFTAQYGWLTALRKIESANLAELGVGALPKRGNQPEARVMVTKTATMFRMTTENIVRYAPLVSPNAARIGVQKGANRFRHVVNALIKEIDKMEM